MLLLGVTVTAAAAGAGVETLLRVRRHALYAGAMVALPAPAAAAPSANAACGRRSVQQQMLAFWA